MQKVRLRDTITLVSIFGLIIAYILVIAINNIIYEDKISLRFMLYCSAYGAPFIIMAACSTNIWFDGATDKNGCSNMHI